MGRLEELAVILFIGVLIFGPNKLKDIAASLGGALSEFKKAMNPEGQNVQTTSAPSLNPPSYAPAAKMTTRRRKSTSTRKKTKTSR